MYHYFPDKNELVQAVIDYQAETIVKHHRKALGNVTCAPSARELPTRGLHG
jgi:AcrR family transcriptional regulator